MSVNRLQQQLTGVHITEVLLLPSTLGQLVQKKSVHEPLDLPEVAGIAGEDITVQGYIGLTRHICLNLNSNQRQLETSHTKTG